MNVEQLVAKGKPQLQQICTDLKITFEDADVKRALAEKIVACKEWPDHKDYIIPPVTLSDGDKAKKETLDAMTLVQLVEVCVNNGIDPGAAKDTNLKDDEAKYALIAEIMTYDNVQLNLKGVSSVDENELSHLEKLQSQCTDLGIEFSEDDDEVALEEKIVVFNSPHKHTVVTDQKKGLSPKERMLADMKKEDISVSDLHDMCDMLIAACKRVGQIKVLEKKSGDRFNMAGTRIAQIQSSMLTE